MHNIDCCWNNITAIQKWVKGILKPSSNSNIIILFIIIIIIIRGRSSSINNNNINKYNKNYLT